MRFHWLVGVFLAVSGAAGAAEPAYALLDLGPAAEQAAGLNDAGQTVFIGDGGVVRYADGRGAETIASGYRRPILGGINGSGQVSFAEAGYGLAHVFRFSDGAGAVEIGEAGVPLEGGMSVTRPNARGDVAYGGLGVVNCYTDDGARGIISENPWMDIAFVNGINDAGTVVYALTSSYAGYNHLASTGAWNWRSGPVDISPIDWGSAINNRGDVAGGIGYEAAIRMTDGTTIAIGRHGFPRALNDHGMAVGAAYLAYAPDGGEADGGAWVFDGIEARDLAGMLDPSLGWSLLSATDINAAGQIAGTGFVNGQRRAFRLTPVNSVPEPGSLALLAVAGLPLLVRRRR
ncbi:MAG TPA: PEP-CTERM sorting domain-containing protein [Armatimonadota bacterium]|jgi:hypothetical protein